MLLPTKLSRLARIFVEFKRRKAIAGALPIRLWIETASCCNLRCVMCPNKSVPGSDKGLMKLDLFKKIIDDAKDFISDAYLHHRGEPLMNPALFDMIRYARAAGVLNHGASLWRAVVAFVARRSRKKRAIPLIS